MTTSAPSTAEARHDAHGGAEAFGVRWHEGARRAQADFSPFFPEQERIRARDAGMRDVPADRDDEPFEATLALLHHERVEQRLGRMLVRAVTGVDDAGVLEALGEERRRTGARMAHDDRVGPHGLDVLGGVEERLALGDARERRAHVDDIGTESLRGDLEGGTRARGGLEEEVHHGAPGEDRRLLLALVCLSRVRVPRLGAREDGVDVRDGELFDPEQMAVRPHAATGATTTGTRRQESR
jgi:hypothetical protein